MQNTDQQETTIEETPARLPWNCPQITDSPVNELTRLSLSNVFSDGILYS